mmetsp:Transcript_31750/g.61973  ORF Transcript_31750/g.61973 Transcript_31750/m.61973 type:complete len:368 (+) Transcript_31750:149-1252(+)
MATPCPPAAHAVTSASFLSSNLRRSVAHLIRRVPVAPKGCPKESEPPRVFMISIRISPTRSRPRFSLHHASLLSAAMLDSTCPANASWNSMMSMSVILRLLRLSSAAVEWAGPSSSCVLGSHPAKQKSLRSERYLIPRDLAYSSDVMSDADAPSVRKEEEAAVTVPWGLIKAGLSAPSFSIEVGRMPLSADTVLPLEPMTGISSCLNSPLSVASCAAWWERAANASWSRREMEKDAARQSALYPMISPVENSATPGAWGVRSARPRPEKSASLAWGVLALPSLSSLLRIGREKRMGRSLMTSTPPAMTTSQWSVWIRPMPVAVHVLAEMQAWVEVCATIFVGRPAPIEASRAMLEVSTSWMTVPIRQ